VLDIVTVLFIIATSFLPRSKAIESLDLVFGVLILADFSARLIISRQPLRDFTRLSTWSDIVAIISFLAPLAGEAGGFLRALRTLRLLRDYQMVARLRVDSSFFRQNEEVIFAVANLAVFIFVMTGIVYETQKSHNNHIVNYADALYFTVTALTTTGFGDITLPGTVGRLITVVIMIFGVTLFLNLAKALLAPAKVRFPCPICGLQRHDSDAVHCKACGTVLNIPDEGSD
jgi:voltage-gated potassium channel